MADISKTIEAKSDQLNADDLIGTDKTIAITKVVLKGADQPVDIFYEGDNGKPFRPSKTCRRILAQAWGIESNDYIGRSMTLYRDPDVRWAGEPVGGIRISHLSDIERPLTLALAVSRGKKKPSTIQVLKTENKKNTMEDKDWQLLMNEINESKNIDVLRNVKTKREGLQDKMNETQYNSLIEKTNAKAKELKIEQQPKDELGEE